MECAKLQKTISLGQLLEVMASIGVIAGIVFLAIELRQNNQLLVEQTRYSMLQNQKEWTIFLTGDPDVSRLAFSSRQSGQLDDLDRIRQSEILTNLLFAWQWEFEQSNSGLFGQSELPLEAYRYGWRIHGLDQVW